MIDIEDILVAMFERYEILTENYEGICPEELFDPDAVLTPLEHCIHVLARELGYDPVGLWKEAITNIKRGKRTSLAHRGVDE